MIDEIKKTFKKRVKEHDWIDDQTTKYVFEKVKVNYFTLFSESHIGTSKVGILFVIIECLTCTPVYERYRYVPRDRV